MSKDTVYTLKLRRRGVDLERHPGTEMLRDTRVEEVMDTSLRALPEDLSVAEAARRLLAARHPALPVTDQEGMLIGIVTVQHLASVLSNDDDRDRIPLSDVAEMPATVLPNAPLQSVLDAVLDSSASAGIPVMGEDGTLRGWLNQEAVLRILSRPGAPAPAKTGAPRLGTSGPRRRPRIRPPRNRPNTPAAH
jgi:CIC family chloride channel protein